MSKDCLMQYVLSVNVVKVIIDRCVGVMLWLILKRKIAISIISICMKS